MRLALLLAILGACVVSGIPLIVSRSNDVGFMGGFGHEEGYVDVAISDAFKREETDANIAAGDGFSVRDNCLRPLPLERSELNLRNDPRVVEKFLQ
ncbi:hypothetical protein F4861DRAFT_543049 [Xylaria intraflava]|nr:hypothetical protein F4861DRAFT_543049 [Xylaria intraflava]